MHSNYTELHHTHPHHTVKLVKLSTVFSDIASIRKSPTPNYVKLFCILVWTMHLTACVWQLLQTDRVGDA
jgi:hypothetical protein